ncbi:MAG: dihydrofolate reductase [bacterium]|nr:dihydrofolate reductase [bacterium]
MKNPIYIIVAVDENNGIGKNGTLPWHFSKEMKYFKKATLHTEDPDKQNMVVMGRKTWESIDTQYRPLKNRKNIVLTHDPDYKAEGAIIAQSLEEAFDLADEEIEKIFIIGGGKVFKDSLKHPKLLGIYLTRIQSEYDCDTFFPEIPDKFGVDEILETHDEKGTKFQMHLLSLADLTSVI